MFVYGMFLQILSILYCLKGGGAESGSSQLLRLLLSTRDLFLLFSDKAQRGKSGLKLTLASVLVFQCV